MIPIMQDPGRVGLDRLMLNHSAFKPEQMFHEPYRLFFPLGTLFAVWGVSIWIFFHIGLIQDYPGALHSHVMIGGFLFSFALGFLMTAIPRFTGTNLAGQREVLAVFIPLGLLPVTPLFFRDVRFAFALPLLASHLALFFFAIPRFVKRKTIIPESFVFLGAGLLSSFVGILIELGVGAGQLSPEWMNLARALFLQCFLLCLVIGVGSRLVPALLGWAMHPAVQTGLFKSTKFRRILFTILAALFPVSYVLEVNGLVLAGRGLRLAITLLITLRYWRILSLPSNRTKLAWSLWVSAWAIPLGMVGTLIWPFLHIHFLHLIFVAGLGLMTFMVATRVVLAHGGYSLLLESSMGSLLGMGGLACLAALIRLSAGVFPIDYFLQLDLAALCWLAMVALWWKDVGMKILPRLILVADEKETC